MSGYLYVDTETNDRVVGGVYPTCIQLAWALDGAPVRVELLRVDVPIAAGAERVHGISAARLAADGLPPAAVYADFLADVRKCVCVVAHNADFDRNVLLRSLRLAGVGDADLALFRDKRSLCSMRLLTPVTCLPHAKRAGRWRSRGARKSFKWPKLSEAAAFFGLPFDEAAAHDAAYDVEALRRVFRAMRASSHPHLKRLRNKSGGMSGVRINAPVRAGAGVSDESDTDTRFGRSSGGAATTGSTPEGAVGS